MPRVFYIPSIGADMRWLYANIIYTITLNALVFIFLYDTKSNTGKAKIYKVKNDSNTWLMIVKTLTDA